MKLKHDNLHKLLFLHTFFDQQRKLLFYIRHFYEIIDFHILPQMISGEMIFNNTLTRHRHVLRRLFTDQKFNPKFKF